MTSQVKDVILPRSHHVTLFHPFVSDQRWPLASDPLHISDPGSKLTPHRGRVQPTDNRAWRAPSPRGRTSMFLIGPCRGWRGYAFKRCDYVEDGEQRARVWGTNTFVVFQQQNPPSWLNSSPQYMPGLQTGEGTTKRERGGPMENEEIKCVLASLWKKK